MRLFGLLFIALSAVMCGICCVDLRKKRIWELRDICSMLEEICRELEIRLTALPEIFRRIQMSGDEKLKSFADCIVSGMEREDSPEFCEIWCSAVKETFCFLDGQEKNELEKIGGILGRYGAERQIEALRECLYRINAKLEPAVKEYP